MPRIVFTSNLQRYVDARAADVPGRTVGEVLQGVFAARPELRTYILDDQGSLRRHVVVFVNGQRIADSDTLSDAVPADGEIYVMQALSGG